jgi:hypothetical protein
MLDSKKGGFYKKILRVQRKFLEDFIVSHPQKSLIVNGVTWKYFDGLKRLYLNAEYHMFRKGLGAHSIALISLEIFNQRIREFLEN